MPRHTTGKGAGSARRTKSKRSRRQPNTASAVTVSSQPSRKKKSAHASGHIEQRV